MENKFEKKISKMLNEDIYIPPKITNRIKTSLKEERKGVWLSMKLNKMIAGVAGIVILGTGVVFAGKAIIDNRYKSINEAKENGYFQEVGGDYVKDAGLSIKISDYFIDTTRAGVTFDIQAEEKIDEVIMYNVAEKTNNPAACDLIRFIDKNGNEIPYEFNDAIGVHIGADFGITKEHLENNIFRMSYLQHPNEDYSEAAKIKVVIKRVVTKTDGREKEYVGNWEFEIDIADKYLDKSDNITYSVSVGGVIVGKAELSATELVVKIDNESSVDWELNKEVISLAPVIEDGDIIPIPRVLKEDGQEIEKVFTSSSKSDDGNMEIRFNISKFSAENSYKIVLVNGTVISLTK